MTIIEIPPHQIEQLLQPSFCCRMGWVGWNAHAPLPHKHDHGDWTTCHSKSLRPFWQPGLLCVGKPSHQHSHYPPSSIHFNLITARVDQNNCLWCPRIMIIPAPTWGWRLQPFLLINPAVLAEAHPLIVFQPQKRLAQAWKMRHIPLLKIHSVNTVPLGAETILGLALVFCLPSSFHATKRASPRLRLSN